MAPAPAVVVVVVVTAPHVTAGLEAWHGLSLEHKPCVVRESVNPFETKSVTLAKTSPEALPAKSAVT